MLQIVSKTQTAIDPIDGFNVKFLQDSDNTYIAYFEQLPDISAFASNTEDAIKELKIAWECAKETYVDFGFPIPSAYEELLMG
jgi:predicted RNase H-like HicB family nuclease